MRKNLLLALLCVALLAVPAFASVQNIKISGDIDSTWIVRDQWDLGIASAPFYQNMLITQTRLRVDADLTDNVGATVALINERAWGQEDPDQTDGDNDIDINLAFVTMREMLYSPLTVVIGRQNFAFGNSFVIDSAGTNNNIGAGGLDDVAEDLSKRTAQDAIRMTLDYNPLTIDLVASKIDGNTLTGAGDQDDDVDLFGMNANYQLGDDMETVVESYFWARIDQSVKSLTPDGGDPDLADIQPKADTIYMPGVRVSSNPIKGLNVQAELAAQFGNRTYTDTNSTTGDDNAANIKRRALAAQIITNYMLPFEQTAQWSPVVTGAYTYTSGDSGPSESADTVGRQGDEYYTAWDPMYENQGAGNIYNALFDLTNSHILTFKAEAQPMEDVTASLEWNGIWLDKKLNDTTGVGATDGTDGVCSGTDCLTIRQPDGTVLNPTMLSNLKIGDEVGVALAYDYTEDVQFGAKLNWFFPGNAFHGDNQEAASQILINGNVNF